MFRASIKSPGHCHGDVRDAGTSCCEGAIRGEDAQETGARMFVYAKGKTRMLSNISSRMRGGNLRVPVPSISVM